MLKSETAFSVVRRQSSITQWTQWIRVPGRRKALMGAIMPAFLLFLLFIRGSTSLASAGNYFNKFAADLLYH